MAYNPYPQYGYQPQQYYTQPVPDQLAQLRQQQMMQPVTQPMTQPTPPVAPMVNSMQNGMIWVSGRAEADGYLVAPNSAVALWDANNPVIYLRKADSTGKPNTTVFDLVERTDSMPMQPAQPVDMSRYVTIDQLEEILAERLKRPARATMKKEDTEDA